MCPRHIAWPAPPILHVELVLIVSIVLAGAASPALRPFSVSHDFLSPTTNVNLRFVARFQLVFLSCEPFVTYDST